MIIWFIIFVLLGLAVGSFLNVCIDRLPADESLISPPSHCSACGRELAVIDLIPVISYVLLRGQCRYCHEAISLRSPLVEAATGLIFALIYWNYGFGLELAISLVYASIFLVIFVIDLEHQLILNKIVYPGVVLALILSMIWPDLFSSPWHDLGRIAPILGGIAGFGIMLLLFLIFRGGFGEGDVKLAAMMGLATGFPLIVVALLLSAVSGGVIAMILFSLGLKKRGDAIPFGPFLASSTVITLLWGEPIWNWYTGLLTM